MKSIALIPWLGLVYAAIISGKIELDVCGNMLHLVGLLVIFTLDVLQLSWERTKSMSNVNMIYSVAYIGVIIFIWAKDFLILDVSIILLFGLTIVEVLLTIIIGKDLARLNVFADNLH